MKKIIFLYTHPIQYFSPFHKELSQDISVESEVLFCQDTSQGYFDLQFGKNLKWDIPLLQGYKYLFLNNSFLSKLGGFFKLSNLSIIKCLIKKRPDILIVHGWSYFTAILAIIVAKILRVKVWLRAETPLIHEMTRSKMSLILRKIILKYLLFKIIDRFLIIGQQNRLFYKYYGIKEHRFVDAPYSVDNDYFQECAVSLFPKKEELKKELNIPPDSRIILFVGKLINKKRPLDLLKAFKNLKSNNHLFLIFVGEGELRIEMEKYLKENNLTNVIITGFVNQSEISKYYSISDLFIMCSDFGETWGLATNEAMNFSLPIIISDMTGNFMDLVNGNGSIFKTGDINDLSDKITQILNLPLVDYNKLKTESLRVINNYSYKSIITSIKYSINE